MSFATWFGHGAVRADEAAFGPLYQEFNLTLTPGERQEAVGPFYFQEEERSEPGKRSLTPALSRKGRGSGARPLQRR